MPAPGSTVYLKFTTRDATGLPTTPAGSPAISIYKDNSVTQSTSGVTLTSPFDSVAGLNHITVDTSSDGTFYSAGSTFYAVITTGTVAGISVVGEVVGQFDLSSGVTVATNNDKTGYALTQSFPSNFASLSISAAGKINEVVLVDTLTTYTGDTPQTGDSYARIGATGSGLSSLAPASTALSTATWTGARAGYLDNLSAGAVALASTALSTAQWTNLRAGYLDNLSAGAVALASTALSTAQWTNARAGYLDNLSAGAVALASSLPSNFAALGITVAGKISEVVLADTVTTYTGNTVQTGDSFARLGAPVGASISADIAAIPADSLTLDTVVPTTGNTANTLADCLNAARAQGFGKWTIVDTTLTLYADDGSTAVRVFTLDSGTAPTSRT